ncbi:uncharacterized protein SCHCODRAFT_02621861 [Schizophyllum commune H4-8]|nr:uncharacterized protein SCHCODRAFT_02621861 [Schizophyllum commune H4-8]KAI5893456.1 hypothetical protein SCHCODRAFT_02621861 [Schizophyllum commune H4-8]
MTSQNNKHGHTYRRTTPSASPATPSTSSHAMSDAEAIPAMPTSMIDNTLIALRSLFSRSTHHLNQLKTTLANERSATAATRAENMQLIQRNAVLRAENDMLKAQLQNLTVHAGRVRDEKEALERICLRMKARELSASQQATTTWTVHVPRQPRRRRAEAFPVMPTTRNRRVHPYASSTDTLVDDLDAPYAGKMSLPSSQGSSSPPTRTRALPRTLSAPAGLGLQVHLALADQAADQVAYTTVSAPVAPPPVTPAAPTPVAPAASSSLDDAAARLSSSCAEIQRFLAAHSTPPHRPTSLPAMPVAPAEPSTRSAHIRRPSSTPLPDHAPMDVDEAPASTSSNAPSSSSGKPRHAAIVLDPSPSK